MEEIKQQLADFRQIIKQHLKGAISTFLQVEQIH